MVHFFKSLMRLCQNMDLTMQFNHVAMQFNHVTMQFNHVTMQFNYVKMEFNHKLKRESHQHYSLHVLKQKLRMNEIFEVGISKPV